MEAKALDLSTLQRLVNELADAKKGRTKAQRLVDVLEMQAGKAAVVLSLTVRNERGSDREENDFRLIDADFYAHRVAQGREPLLTHMQRFAREQLIAWNSKVEGIEFQIRRLTRG